MKKPYPESFFSDIQYSRESKASRKSYVGLIGEQKIKIYQAHSPEHAKFIKTVSEHPSLTPIFPHTLWISDEYVAAEWIRGKTGEAALRTEGLKTVRNIAAMQILLHSIDLNSQFPTAGYDYIEFLSKRVTRFGNIWPLTPNIEKVLESISSKDNFKPQRISHPDVTPRNIVHDLRTHTLKIVDNELLHQSPFFLLDLFNTCHSLRDQPDLVEVYLTHYFESVDKAILKSGRHPSLPRIWAVRLIGSYFQNGDPDAAYRVADTFDAVGPNDYPVVKFMREKI